MDIKQFALAVHNFAFGTNWDDEDIVSAMGFDMIVEKMKKDEKELKEKYEEGVKHVLTLTEQNKELWLDNESLGLQDKELKQERDNLREEVAKLKEEVDKWKYWASEVIYWSRSGSLDILGFKKLITDTNQPTIADVRDFGKELTKLKEENKKLKEVASTNYQKQIAMTLMGTTPASDKDEIKELKQCNLFLKAECCAGGWNARDNDPQEFADSVKEYFMEYQEHDKIENVEELYEEWKEWANVD